MPIASGATGRPRPLASPGDRFMRGKPFRSRPFSTYNATISGVTRDGSGTALGGCTVRLFGPDDVLIAIVVSDGSGAFAFYPSRSGPYYLVAYRAGAPDVAGTTLNTLTAT